MEFRGQIGLQFIFLPSAMLKAAQSETRLRYTNQHLHPWSQQEGPLPGTALSRRWIWGKTVLPQSTAHPDSWPPLHWYLHSWAELDLELFCPPPLLGLLKVVMVLWYKEGKSYLSRYRSLPKIEAKACPRKYWLILLAPKGSIWSHPLVNCERFWLVRVTGEGFQSVLSTLPPDLEWGASLDCHKCVYS